MTLGEDLYAKELVGWVLSSHGRNVVLPGESYTGSKGFQAGIFFLMSTSLFNADNVLTRVEHLASHRALLFAFCIFLTSFSNFSSSFSRSASNSRALYSAQYSFSILSSCGVGFAPVTRLFFILSMNSLVLISHIASEIVLGGLANTTVVLCGAIVLAHAAQLEWCGNTAETTVVVAFDSADSTDGAGVLT